MARCRMLDVPGHEPRSFAARRAVRFHLEPQLRGAAGAGWPHPPYVAGDGRCGGNIWCNRGCERAGVNQIIEHRGIAEPLRLTNVNTDKILPGRFHKTITREGMVQPRSHEWEARLLGKWGIRH